MGKSKCQYLLDNGEVLTGHFKGFHFSRGEKFFIIATDNRERVLVPGNKNRIEFLPS